MSQKEFEKRLAAARKEADKTGGRIARHKLFEFVCPNEELDWDTFWKRVSRMNEKALADGGTVMQSTGHIVWADAEDVRGYRRKKKA